MNKLIAEKPSLLTRYENLRRKEFERLSSLLDTLGKIDGLPNDQMDQARDALFHADHPFLIVLVGAFNTGKSSIINALIGQSVLEVGATPTTSKIAIVRHGPAVQRTQTGDVETLFYPVALLEQVSLVDTPGLDSVFKEHDERTRRFLHRADIVLLVMMATQAMSASNVEYLQSLRSYGKRVIVVINQIDTLEPEELETLKTFVADRSKVSLGFVPEIWLLSARQAMEAQQTQPRNQELWNASGFGNVEKFITEALNDSARVRQKLETPLQIARNVTSVANAQVREQQNAMADYRRSSQNVKSQMDAGLREQQTTVRQTINEVDETFAEATRRGREAIGDIFQPSRATALAVGGVTELLGVARVVRRLGGKTPAAAAFETRKVNDPLNQIPAIIDRLGPRLEGRDVKDVDDLIAYTKKEIEQLPAGLQQKVIGKLVAPATYDRSIMRSARDGIMSKLEEARTFEFKRIDQAVRNSVLFLGAYEMILLIAAILAALSLVGSPQNGAWALLLIAVIVLGLAGIALIPLRGALMERAYAQRLIAIKTELEQALDRVAQQQIAFGSQMRNDAVSPFMRLVETQISQADQLKTELETHQQGLVALEKELGDLKE